MSSAGFTRLITIVSSSAWSLAVAAVPFAFTTVDFPSAQILLPIAGAANGASGINNTGQIVGIYDDLAGRHGFLRSNGIFKTLDPPTVLNRFSTEASAINDLGQIVGSYLACESCPSPLRGFVSSGGVFTDIIHPAAGPGGITSPQGINNAGQIVGSYIGPAGVYRGFMLSAGVFTAIDFPGATNTFVNGINNAGVIVGGYDNGPSTHRHGFLLRAGAFTLIDLPGSSYTEARSINDSGQIVGDYADSLGSYSHGFFSSGGSFSPVDFPGASNNEASGINNAGQIVGLYSGGVHGFLAQAAPAVTTPAALPTGTTGSFYSQTLAASGGTAPYTWSTISGSLPLGLTLSSAGAITGTPTSPGTSNFTVRVTDSVGSSTTQAFSLTIATGLTILTPAALPTGTTGSFYSQTLAASGGSAPYTWSTISGSLPLGLTVSSAGAITGTPTSPGTSSFTVRVTDSVGSSMTQAFALTINQQSTGLTILTTSALPSGTVGVAYSQGFSATGGSTPYKGWVLASGTLPPGTSLTTGVLAGTELLSGTPTAAGTFQFTLQLTDNVNSIAAKQFSVTIVGGSTTLPSSAIVNAASYATGSVAPGEIIAIFGSFPGPPNLITLQFDSQGHVSTNLGGAQVLFDGAPAPMVFALSGQMSAVVPYGVVGKTSTQVQLSYQGQLSNSVSVPVALAVPGIFTADASGHGQGAILNQDGTVNSANNPAAAGSYVFVYGTGEGQTSPPGVDGTLDGSPAPTPVQTVTASVGGVNANVAYAGGSPGLVAGVLQVNVQVPQTTAAGNSVPIVLNIGGTTSQTGVTIAVNGASSPPASSIAIALYSDSSGSPGTLLATIGTLDKSQLSASPATVDLPLATPYRLAANTKYWIGMSTAMSGPSWSWSADQIGMGVSGQSFANDGGVSPNTLGAYQMRITTATASSATLVIYDNLSSVPASIDFVAADGPLYDSFLTGDSTLNLTDVKLLLSNPPTSPPLTEDDAATSGSAAHRRHAGLGGHV